MLETRHRFDMLVPLSGRATALWGLSLTDLSGRVREYLLGAYELPKTVRAVRADLHAGPMLFEFSLFSIDPATPLDMNRSLFEQPKVSPLTPAQVCFQVRTVSTDQIIQRLNGCVFLIKGGSMHPEQRWCWEAIFHDGVEVHTKWMDVAAG